MKQFITVSRAALLVMVLAFFAACTGGTFIDPGQGGGGGGSGSESSITKKDTDKSSTKPTSLANDASWAQADAKLDAIIAYCDSTSQSTVKTSAVAYKSAIADSTVKNNWTTVRVAHITAINAFITSLP